MSRRLRLRQAAEQMLAEATREGERAALAELHEDRGFGDLIQAIELADILDGVEPIVKTLQ